MEITIQLPPGTDTSPIYDRFGWEVVLDRTAEDCDEDFEEYFMGQATEDLEPGEADPFDFADCLAAMAWIEGRYPDSYVSIQGNGAWANGEDRKRPEYKLAFAEGKASRTSTP